MSSFDGWNEELYHWGILGMKHGRRQYQNIDGTWTEEGLARRRERERKTEAKIAKKAAKLEKKTAKALAKAEKRKKISAMSDEEIQKRIDRLKLENEYKKLQSESNSYFMANGRNFIEKWMEHSDRKALNNIKMKELEVRYVESINRTKQATQQRKQATQQRKQAEAQAEQKRQEKWISRSKSKRLQAKAEMKLAKYEKQRLKFIKQMYKDAPDATKQIMQKSALSTLYRSKK